MFTSRISDLDVVKLNNDLEILKNSVLLERQRLKERLRLMSSLIFRNVPKSVRQNSKMSNAITRQFCVNDFDSCIALDKKDILEREKEIFKRLNLKENCIELKRKDDYIGACVSRQELIEILLEVKDSHKINLDTCILLLDSASYAKVFSVDDMNPNIYGIPVGSDINYPMEYKCLDSRLVIVPKTYEMSVYRDEFNVELFSCIKYTSYHSYLPEIRSTKFISVKLRT